MAFSFLKVLFCLLPATVLFAQPYNFVTFSLPEGLPQSQVFAMCQDRRGYLWLGTQGGGLSRFDGQRFETFTTADGLPSNYINALLEDAQHRLWVGTNQGLCRFDGRRFEPVGLAGAPSEVYALAQVQGQSVWIGAGRGLFACAPDEKEARPLALPGSKTTPAVTAILPTAEGAWVGTSQGAWHLGTQNFRLSEKAGLAGTSIFAFARDRHGRLWIASLGGLTIWDENRQKPTAVFRDAALYRPVCLQPGPDGRMWVGTANAGLLCYQPADSSWTRLAESDGLPHQHVHTLLFDNSGQLWAGTSGGGIARASSQPFRHFNQSKGLAGNRVYALHEDRSGRLWLGVSQNGLQLLDSAGFHPFDRDSGYLRIKCKTIAEDPEGNTWVGTEGKGIAVFDSGGMHVLSRRDGLPSELVQKIVAGAAGEMWAATLAGGIAKITRQPDGAFAIRVFGRREGLPDLQVLTLQTDEAGGIWFATASGHIGCIRNDRVEPVFGSNNGLPGVAVRALALSSNGRIWAGTKSAGLFWANRQDKTPVFRAIDSRMQPHSPNIYLLHFDAGGNLWAGTETGVDQLLFNPAGEPAESRHFGKTEGFLGIETCQDAVLLDRNGRLWFGTMNGLTQQISAAWEKTSVPPVLHIESISLFYRPLRQTVYAGWVLPEGGLRRGLELPHHQNHLSFAFRAVDLSNPDGVRYRWRLLGAEADWSPWSTQQQVNYANLAPGQYTFAVQTTSDGETPGAPLLASFVIKDPFWRLWWFQVLAALLLLAIGILTVFAWVRRIRRAERSRREKLEVENRMLQLEQKALQLQMNPHFIFNALTSIQALITEQDYPQARQEINKFAQLMRSVLHNSRRSTISLLEEVNTLEQYLRIEQFCHRQKFDFEINLPAGLDAEEVEIPPMLLQPFVENAVVHGVSPLPYPGKIAIGFSLENEVLRCEICDNGIGRERAARLREEKKPGHQSAALQVTQERLEALRAGKPWKALEISDITDENGEIAGTRVVLRLPVRLNF